MFIIKENTEGGKGTPKETKEAIIKWMESEGMIIRTSEEDKTLIESRVQDEVDSVLSKRNQQITDDIKALTGVDPQGNEKWHDYMKRAVKDKVTNLSSQIEEIKKEKGKNDTEEIKSLKAQITDLEKLAETKENEKAKLVEDFEKQRIEEKNQSVLKSSIESMRKTFKDADEKILNDAIEARERRFREKYEIRDQDGISIIYSKEDGKPVRNEKGQPKTLEDHLKADTFSDMIDPVKSKSGAGTGGKGNGSGDGGAEPNKWSGAKVKATNQVELYSELEKEHKLKPDSKEFNDAYDTIIEENKLPLR